MRRPPQRQDFAGDAFGGFRLLVLRRPGPLLLQQVRQQQELLGGVSIGALRLPPDEFEGFAEQAAHVDLVGAEDV